MPSIRNAGAEIYYETYGEGPALVFAHGAGGNAAIWWQQVPVFVELGYQVVCFDHRGFARSRCETDELKIGHFPSDLLAILDAEEIPRAALVCQSMGGWTGLPTTLRHPDRVRALVLCGTPGGVWTPEVAEALRSVGDRIRERGGLTGPGGAAIAESFAEQSPHLAFLYDQISSFNQLGEVGPVLGQISELRFETDDLASLKTPTLVIAGTEDVLFPLDAMRSVAGGLPGAELTEMEGAGHSTYFEKPEAFNRLVADFVSRHP